MRWSRWLVCALVLWTGAAHAADSKTYPAQGPQKFLGLDDTSAPTQLQDGRSSDLQNVSLGISQDLRKRYGYKVIGDTADIPDESFCAVTGLYSTTFSSGTTRNIRTCADRFSYLNGTTWTLVSGGKGRITGGQDNQFVWTTALDNIIGTNNVNAPIQWAGGASDTVTGVTFTGLTYAITKAKAEAFFKNYLIFGQTTENGTLYPTRIRWSNVGTINTWTDADYIDIDAQSGQELVALVPLYDQLYAFFTSSIYRISLVGGTSTFQIARVSDRIGSIAKNSIQSITLQNGQVVLVFLDKSKRVFYTDGSVLQELSPLIHTALFGLSASRLQYAVSADSGTDYLLCATNSTGTTNDLCVAFQYQIGEWTRWTQIPANAMARVFDANNLVQVYWGSYKSLVYQLVDTSLTDDVGSSASTVSTVQTYTTSTASGLQVLYNSSLSLTTGALIGAPIKLTGGTGAGLTSTVAYNTPTGIVVTDAFSTTPTSGTNYEVGSIDAYYVTKWYDFNDPARIKQITDLYFWADADVNSTLSVSYATDFNSNIATISKSLSASSSSLWGTGLWGTATWGSGNTIFENFPMNAEGRYVNWTFADDDPGESFHLYGFVSLYQPRDVQ